MNSFIKLFALLAVTIALTSCWETKQGTTLAELAQGLLIKGQRRVLTGECHPFTVHAISKNGSLMPETTVLDLTIQVGGSTSYIDDNQVAHLTTTRTSVYSDSSCTQPTRVARTNGSAPKFFVKASGVENVFLLASDTTGGLSSTSANLQTFGPTGIVLTGPSTVIAGVCTTRLTVNTVDPNGNPFPIGWSDSFVFIDATGGLFYQDSDCGTPLVSRPIPRDGSPVEFYYKNDNRNTPSLGITTVLNSLGPRQHSIRVLERAGISVTTSRDNFAVDVNDSTDFTVTLAHTGEVAATSIVPSVAAPYQIIDSTCGTTLPVSNPASTCTLQIRFTPPLAQSYPSAVTVNFFNGAVNDRSTRDYTGRGILPAGSDDPTYGTGGRVLIDTNSSQRPYAALAGSGRLLIAQADTNEGKIRLIRLLSNGAFDTNFGSNGINLVTPDGGLPVIRGLHTLANGTAILVGELGGKLALYQIENNGTLGQPNLFTINADPLLEQVDAVIGASALSGNGNRILVSLTAEGKFLVGGFLTNRTVDTGFGVEGFMTETFSSLPEIAALTLDSSGKISVGLNFSGSAVVVRYLSTGSADNAFGPGSSPGANQRIFEGDVIRSMAASGTRTILGMGGTLSNDNFLLKDMASNGSLTREQLFDFGESDLINTLAVDDTGRILTAGRSSSRSALLRTSSGLAADASFGINGRVLHANAETFQVLYRTGEIYLVGVANGDLFIRRQTNADR